MYDNFTASDVSHALPILLRQLLRAPEVPSRAGKTKELTHVGITLLEPLKRELLVPGRNPNLVAQIAETAWVLAGRNDVEWLSHYLPRAGDFSDDGKTWRSGYGPRLRDWHGVDQLADVVARLREDPTTRRATAVLWDPQTDRLDGKDIACNNWLHFLARNGRLDLHVAIRSNDVMWGWSGINAFEWSVLLEVVAGLTGLEVGALHFSTSSLHLYERHWEKAERIVREQERTRRADLIKGSPRFQAGRVDGLSEFDDLLHQWFSLEYDIRTGSPLVGHYVDTFPEPMLRSWLIVLDWWWNGRFHGAIEDLKGTALGVAATVFSVKPKWARTIEEEDITFDAPEPAISPFLSAAIALHNEKHAAYGDSWKRRGEYMILANIARKVDRLGGGETSDETSADTAMDLMIYLAKYQIWLADNSGATPRAYQGSDTPDEANSLLVKVEQEGFTPLHPESVSTLEEMLRDDFDQLEALVAASEPRRHQRVGTMLRHAYRLARYRWERRS